MKTRPLEDAALVAALLLSSLPAAPAPTGSSEPEKPAARRPS